jgi:leucine dehydrogenase
MMDVFEQARRYGHEEVVLVQDAPSGLRAVVAIHDTTLGPAVGGTRMKVYGTLDEAALDALRLSRAMTYKAVMCGVERGGGKAVILGDPSRQKTRGLLSAYAKVLDRFGGRFQTGCDMGIDNRDVAVLARMTKHVSHTPADSRIDTADLAALGTQEAVRAAAEHLGTGMDGLKVAIQGLGQVGLRLARSLAAEGARLTVADVDPGRVDRCVQELGATAVDAEAIYDAEVDVFSPNAGTGILNDGTVPRLRCRAVVGAANEQLLEPRHGDLLHERGIVYGPDYVVNAGGLLSLLFENGEEDEDGVRERVRKIGPRTAEIWRRAERDGLPPHRVADTIAERRLEEARDKRGRGLP